MTPLPGALGGERLVVWRLDDRRHAATWDSGEGAFLSGGRWNSRGRRVVYCAIDPATVIIEVAVHKGFRVLDTVPHVLTSVEIFAAAYSRVYVVQPQDIPNRNWLTPGTPGAGQQAFGDALLRQHPFILIPSVVSSQSWNLVFDCTLAKGMYKLHSQDDFALDTRLHPAEN